MKSITTKALLSPPLPFHFFNEVNTHMMPLLENYLQEGVINNHTAICSPVGYSAAR